MESELSFALRNILSFFDLLTAEDQKALIAELQIRAGLEPAQPTDTD